MTWFGIVIIRRTDYCGGPRVRPDGATITFEKPLKEKHLGDGLLRGEVANLSRNAQARLHRVVEYQTFQRVGGSKPVKVDVRLIAATNADLAAMIKRGEFMPDLYDRLNVVPLEIPPLRARREDIPLLAEHFLARHVAEHEANGNGEEFDIEVAPFALRAPYAVN